MSKQFRLNPETGIPEVMILEPGGPILLGREKRVSKGRLINIHHFYDPELNHMVFHMDGIRIDMLHHEEWFGDGEIFYNSDNREEEECEPIALDYDQPVLFILSGDDARLTDVAGACLSGSNVHSHGVLCLGSGFNPMSLQALDMLLYNEPNHDLGWYGSAIQINMTAIPIDLDESTPLENYWKITSWPSTTHRIDLSRRMKDVLAHLQP